MSLRTAGIDFISPSQAATLTSCERRWWWRKHHKLYDPPSEPLAMGSGLAKALEVGDVQAGIAEYRRERPPVDEFTDPDVDQHKRWVGEATILLAYAGYVERWPDPAGTVREQTYLVPADKANWAGLRETERLLQVRVDGVTPTHLIEDKLRSGSTLRPEDVENEVRQGQQITAEIYVHWRATGEILPVRFRCVRKANARETNKTVGKTLNKAETYEEVFTILGEHFASDVAFAEYEATRTEAQLVAVGKEMLEAAVRADELAACDTTPSGRRNLNACFRGGQACPALAYCQGMAEPSVDVAA